MTVFLHENFRPYLRLVSLCSLHPKPAGPCLQLQNQTELRATSAEWAAFFLDVALAARSSSQAPMDQEAQRNSHFLFTLHLHQERADKSNKAAGECERRVHLADGRPITEHRSQIKLR